MMPECLDCSNSVVFVHAGDATELRIYDNGEFTKSEHQQFETRSCWCDECESENVRFD
ncbi:hypothetical protein [Haloglomus halophilum]|uniref:hypothetical protein n=1 Tax=Haloglomus halophilum TaxID=2962672 RepID=UPI0020C9A7D1|nr:hypothetical protein [Haloglomus halophilum]